MDDSLPPQAQDDVVCYVTISIYKPTSYTDHWVVRTRDRGAAIRSVMTRYAPSYLFYVNGVTAEWRNLGGDLLKYPEAPVVP